MDRLRVLWVLGFIAGNLVLLHWCWPDQPAVPIAILEARIRTLSAELQRAEEATAWKSRVRAALENPPGISAAAVLQRVQSMAQRYRPAPNAPVSGASGEEIIITETAHHGDRPERIQFAGTGPYRAMAGILTDINRDPAIVVKRISMSHQGPGRITARVEALVRNGPWEGPRLAGVQPEPNELDFGPTPAIGTKDLFGTAVTVTVPLRVNRPAIVYTGFFAETGSPTVMLMEQQQFLVIKAGDKTPGNVSVVSATPDRVTLRDERGVTPPNGNLRTLRIS